MNFASDNWSGACEPVLQAIGQENKAAAPAYGEDALTGRVAKKFCEIFERDVAVFPVISGTAANAIALSALTPAGGMIACHHQAHINVDECNAYGFLSPGGRLVEIEGEKGKIDIDALSRIFSGFHAKNVHLGRLSAVSVTQASEAGTVYTLDEIAEIRAICDHYNVALHMDGARFANALSYLDVSPAQMSWRAGVDILSFGATKNGCLQAEAIILFDVGRAEEFGYLRKRSGHLASKLRFLSAQFEAYFDNDNWLKMASHANEMARQLCEILSKHDQIELAYPRQANSVFAYLPDLLAKKLQEAGARFYSWPHHPAGAAIRSGTNLYRFVTSFQTQKSELELLSRLLLTNDS